MSFACKPYYNNLYLFEERKKWILRSLQKNELKWRKKNARFTPWKLSLLMWRQICVACHTRMVEWTIKWSVVVVAVVAVIAAATVATNANDTRDSESLLNQRQIAKENKTITKGTKWKIEGNWNHIFLLLPFLLLF